MEVLGRHLQCWGSKIKRDRGEKKQCLEAKLIDLQDKYPDDEVLVELTETQLGINLEANKEELFWEQRTRVDWL